MNTQFTAMLVGLDGLLRSTLDEPLKKFTLLEVGFDLEALLENEVVPAPAMIVVGPPPKEISQIEVAQGLRMIYQASPIYAVTFERQGFDRKNFLKNGFTDAFLLPVDLSLLEQAVLDSLANASSGATRSFREVQLLDIMAGEALSFDTYVHLPMNQKYVKFSKAGEDLDQERIAKLKNNPVKSIHVTHDQLGKFYDFTATQLRKLGDAVGMSETEKREKMQNAIRDLLGTLYKDSSKDSSTLHGKALVTDCQQIVKSFILGGSGAKNSWYERILMIGCEKKGTGYSHSSNVATFAALFSLGLGIGKPEDLAMAGILHDIGVADLPREIQMKRVAELNPEEQKIYQRHPQMAIDIIQNRKLIVPENVMTVILMHHERIDGSGYPDRAYGKLISPEIQVLALADEFDEIVSGSAGVSKRTPADAIVELKKRTLGLTTPYDPELIKRLLKLFSTNSECDASNERVSA